MGVKVKERVLGSGGFWIFINHNGRRKAKKVCSEEAALKVKAMIEARLVLGNSALPEEKANPAAPTLEQYYKTFEKIYMETVRFSTRSSYEGKFRIHVLPELGRFRLDEINR
jgi:integrase